MSTLVKNNLSTILTIITIIGGFILQWGSLKAELKALTVKADNTQTLLMDYIKEGNAKNNEQDQRITRTETKLEAKQ